MRIYGAHGLANGLDAVLMQQSSCSVGTEDIQLLFTGDGRCKPALERRVDSQLLHCLFAPDA